MNRIIWSPKAVASLQKLIDFVETKWGTKPADKLLDEIDRTVERISLNPKIYPLFSKKKNLRRCVIARKTLLFYREKSNRIEIVVLVDSRQNPKKYFI
ncbi:MAG TPA: type II toxin-antitoxin system RelE/ParE family toxin [Bacteroidia bacterium]|nr:type II toxin-antitoxin system RelE/ParE family toxin [Bacteroidia bacterium]